ncbi:universal stress protein [Candidatus Entotheonella palauensis]|uniref:universal stress protein n=1 Tax=Candidatus Entotheonella palauensis TaxID=93172 RepID=UPI0015C41672|nr:universal stress protein [Candidatus Entotheonella palauensis]
MAIKDLVVHVDSSQAVQKRLEAAIRIAQTHDAHLTGLYVIPTTDFPAFMEVPSAFEAIQKVRQYRQQEAETSRAAFEEATHRAGVSAEWRCAEGELTEKLGESARYSDLVILGQHNPDEHDANQGLADRLVLEVGRPCLVIPYIGARETLGQRVLVAWNARREAVRAVNDALPILQAADRAVVLSVNLAYGEDGEGDIPSADICHHLARHGVKAEAETTVAKDIDVGSLLLSHAADMGADMIVMGAYGHSRFREMVLGGVSREMFRTMTVPVFMSH